MSSKRAAAYVGGALLVAYLAAANGSLVQDGPPAPRAVPAAAPAPDMLAQEVASQAATLRERVAVAPAPAMRARNPFTFAPGASSRRALAPLAPAGAAGPAAALAVPDLVPLSLMGIAEDPSPSGPRRTAIISGPGDTLYMVMEGQIVADRYRVTAIDPDAVELKDLQTGGLRRLAMR